MRRALCFLLTAALATALSACGGMPLSEPTQTVALHETVPPTPENQQEPNTETSPICEPENTLDIIAEPENWEEIFREFLSNEYEKLLDACMVGIAGVGFIDLDDDGSPELIIFDAGASAAMGVQIFDIINGGVQCISANMSAVGEAYGGEYLSSVYINAHMFDDFRFMREIQSGERFFCVTSSNGAIDFSYSELIRFSGNDSVFSLESVLYKYESYNPDTGETVSALFEKAGTVIGIDEYNAAYEDFFGANEDLGYEAVGTFIWEGAGYENGFDGFMMMVENSFKNYVPLP